jgi:methyl-accepting chemotaxis protein
MTFLGTMKIGTRLTLLLGALVAAVFAATVVVTMLRVDRLATDDAKVIAASTATQVAESAQSQLDVAMDTARTMANVFESAANVDGLKLTRRRANAILKYFIEKNTEFPDIWAVFAPNAFDGNDANFRGDKGTDDTGRFIPTWGRDKGGQGIVEANKDYETKGPGDYYLVPRERKRESVIDPYPYELLGTQTLLSSLAVPVLDADGTVRGIVGVDLDLHDMQKQLGSMKIGQFTRAAMELVSANGTVAAGTSAQFLGKSIDETSTDKAYLQAVHAGQTFTVQGYSASLKEPALSVGVPVEIGRSGQNWMVVVHVSLAEALAAGRMLTILLLAIGFGGVAFLVVMVFLVSRSISRPLAEGVRFARQIAAGDLTATVDVGHRADEIGMLAGALNEMVQNLRNLVHQVQQGATQLAASSEELSGTAQQLAQGAQTQASTLEETSAAVEELSSSVEQVSGHAQSQSSSVTQTSASMDQMMKSVTEVSGTLGKVAESASTSVRTAEAGAASVRQAVSAIKDISQSSERIAGIVGVITDIADQTNLLALNASIEAARAGEHGRGFAVVADEVSKLAERSATSTKEIEALIRESLRQVKQGVDLAEGSGRSMAEIIAGASSSAAMVKDLQHLIEQQLAAIKEVAGAVQNLSEMSQGISAATEEQTENSRQVSKAIESVNDLTQQAAASAEQMASSTEELSAMAQQLQGMVTSFKLEKESAAPAPVVEAVTAAEVKELTA